MSPDLERLLNAIWERDTTEPKNQVRWRATVERLIADALARQPVISREQFMDALEPRLQEFRRQKRKQQTPRIPPKA